MPGIRRRRSRLRQRCDPTWIDDFVLQPRHREHGMRLSRRNALLRENTMGIWDAPDGISLCDAPFVAARKPFENFSEPIGIPGFAVHAEKKREILIGILPRRQFQYAGLRKLRVITRRHPKSLRVRDGGPLLTVDDANIRGF